MNNPPRVVIIGGGFGGLCAARGLVGAPVSVTLIDKRNYHLFRPMLYQVATGLLSADQISRPLRSKFQRDWTRRETYEAARAIVVEHAGGYGIGLDYARDMI